MWQQIGHSSRPGCGARNPEALDEGWDVEVLVVISGGTVAAVVVVEEEEDDDFLFKNPFLNPNDDGMVLLKMVVW